MSADTQSSAEVIALVQKLQTERNDLRNLLASLASTPIEFHGDGSMTFRVSADVIAEFNRLI